LTSFFQRNIKHFCATGLPLSNSFEEVVFTAFPGLRRLKETLFFLGAGAAVLSGSGSAMFGLFRDREQARQAAAALHRQGAETWLVFPDAPFGTSLDRSGLLGVAKRQGRGLVPHS
jgi:4-diphosphocytidyl-2-C-methyl-D-erythritol kinase